MIRATMNDEMRSILKGIIGTQLISYETEKDPSFSRVYGNLRINTSAGSIEIANEEQDFPFFDETEDMTCFSCVKANPNIPFEPAVVTDTQVIDVNNTITSVDIISDTIDVNHGEYQITFDAAIVVHMGDEVLMLARDTWFSELITIVDKDDYDQIFSIDDVKEAWSNDGDYDVDVQRIKSTL